MSCYINFRLIKTKVIMDSQLSDLVAKFKSNEIDLHKFVESVSGIGWGLCDWGSCQYATAQSMFETLTILKNAGYDPTEVIGWGPLNKLAEQPSDFRRKLLQIMLSCKIAVDRQDIIEDYADTKEEQEKELEKLDKILNDRSGTFDNMFQYMCDSAWDLWSAAAMASKVAFGTTFESDNITSYGVGPVMNQLVQSGNYTTGLQCFMLVEFGFVKNPDQSFADFDT